MSIPELLNLAESLRDVLKSPESYKPMSTPWLWTIVAVVIGFFVVFGWLYIHGQIH